MKPLPWGIAGALLVAAGLPACKSRPPGARLVLEVPQRDLGKLPEEQSAVARFPIRNDGAAPLHIYRVEGSCGCLSPEFPTTLPSGARGEIRVRFEPQALWSGQVQKEVVVFSDDPRQPEAPLRLTADIQPVIRVEPPAPVVLEYLPGRTYERDLQLIPRSDRKVVIRNPRSGSPLVKATLAEPRAGDPSQAYHLHLKITPPPAGGDFNATVTLSTTEPRVPELPVLVAGLAQTGIVVSPNEVAVPLVETHETGKELGRLQVFTRTGKFHVLGVDTGNDSLRAVVTERSPGAQYEVTLRYAGGWKPSTVTSTLRIRTDLAASPRIEVPFRALVQ